MSPSENISKLIQEYNNILLRDFGFSGWEDWEPMITKVMDVLGVDSLGDLHLEEVSKCPGKTVVLGLLKSWATGRGKLWESLYRIDEYHGYGPYKDYYEYTIKIMTLEELISGMTGPEAFREYNTLLGIWGSQDYKTLRKLHGVHIRI